jgi:acyl dehydratase
MRGDTATAPWLEPVVGDDVVVTPRLAMAYSAGLLLAEDRFYGVDASAPAVLPFVCTRLEWPVTLGFRNALGLAPDQLARGVHARQDTQVHRPFSIGESVRTTGQMVEARQTRAGALTVIRYQTRSLTRGDLVTTSWSSGIYRGVALPIEPFQAVASPADLVAPAEGRETSVDIHFPIHLTHAYTECADIWNPIHTEEPVARAAGLPRIIVHGTILWALSGVRLADLVLGGDIGRIRRFNGRFLAPVLPNATARLVVRGEGPVFGYRLEDPATGVVHVSGEADGA